MMNKILMTLITIIVSSTAYADCEGTSNIRFESNKVEFRDDSTSAWIPGTIEVNGALRQCVNNLTLKPVSSNTVQLKSASHSLDGILMDANFIPLSTLSGGRYILPLEPDGITKLWLRLPTAGFSPTGKYSGRLQTKFPEKMQLPPRFVELKYNSIPVVSMKVPTASESWLSQSGNNYRVDLGEMTHGVQRDIQLALKSNALVEIRISSKEGKLQHETLRRAKINYKIKLNGQRFLPKQSIQMNVANIPSNRYSNIPFSIIVDPQPRAYAGKYSDQLTLTVSAK
ncbi:hypothetical protein L4D20_11890 [Vibrio kyushuensis]|uniref:hypothetical protein n=1 Tax=Vibrio kyushuensis TaxID=2910249 RepID=UPI003D0CA983